MYDGDKDDDDNGLYDAFDCANVLRGGLKIAPLLTPNPVSSSRGLLTMYSVSATDQRL
jgi:hypothetical protein